MHFHLNRPGLSPPLAARASTAYRKFRMKFNISLYKNFPVKNKQDSLHVSQRDILVSNDTKRMTTHVYQIKRKHSEKQIITSKMKINLI